MYALIEDNAITKTYNNPRGMTIGGVQYPQNIHSLWSESDLNAIGIYTVVYDNTNKKDEEWYINTNQALTFAGGVVTATYGTATDRAIADSTYTNQDNTDGLIPAGKSVGDVKTEGLKTIKKRMINNECYYLLKDSDWIVIKAEDTGVAMNSDWKTWRAGVRTKCNSMQTQVDGAANVDALAALFTYTTTDGVTSRPLGEFPDDPNAE